MLNNKNELEEIKIKYKQTQKSVNFIKAEKEILEAKFFETITNLEKLEGEFSKQFEVNQKLAEKLRQVNLLMSKVSQFEKDSDRNYQEIIQLKEENLELKTKMEEINEKHEYVLFQNRKLMQKLQSQGI